MIEVLWDWIVGLPQQFNYFFTWVLYPLPYLNIAPLYIIGFSGLTTIIAFHVVRLVIGG